LKEIRIRFTIVRVLVVLTAIDRRNFFYPAAAVTVFEIEHRIGGPVKVISNEGYLLMQLVKWVA